MSQVIRVPADIYSRLEKRASGFDTPADVIERLLNHYEDVEKNGVEVPTPEGRDRTGVERIIAIPQVEVPTPEGRDRTQYSFNGQIYCKRKLVLAVVKDYVSKNSPLTFERLQNMFPKNLEGGSYGVFNKIDDVQERYTGEENERHFMDEQIQLEDCTVVVCTEWKIGNICNFITRAKNNGYEISKC